MPPRGVSWSALAALPAPPAPPPRARTPLPRIPEETLREGFHLGQRNFGSSFSALRFFSCFGCDTTAHPHRHPPRKWNFQLFRSVRLS